MGYPKVYARSYNDKAFVLVFNAPGEVVRSQKSDGSQGECWREFDMPETRYHLVWESPDAPADPDVPHHAPSATIDPEGDAREQIGKRCESGCATRPIDLGPQISTANIGPVGCEPKGDEPLTKRERFAMKLATVMYTAWANDKINFGKHDADQWMTHIIDDSIEFADKMLAELAKEPS